MIRPVTRVLYVGHDGAPYFDRRDVIELDGQIGRVLHMDPRRDVLTVDFFGVVRTTWFRLRARWRHA